MQILKDKEAWKCVPELEAWEVSYTGLIRVTETKLLVYPNESQAGYAIVSLDGTPYRLHRLVYLAWIGPLIQGLVIMHLDDQGWNNQVGNLKQGTYKDNALMGVHLRKERAKRGVEGNRHNLVLPPCLSEGGVTNYGRRLHG